VESVKSAAMPLQKIAEGDAVQLKGQDYVGTILSIRGDQVVVQFGLMRSTVSTNQLIAASRSAEKGPGPASNIDIASRRSVFQSDLDLRGSRVEEASGLLASFMDEAVLLGLTQVRILHGKGEGVLRKIVRDYLKKVPSVASVSDEHADRGGAGYTVVVLK